jgi:hypothetical protein
MMRKKHITKEDCMALLRIHIQNNLWEVNLRDRDQYDTQADIPGGRQDVPPKDGNPTRIQNQLVALFLLLRCAGEGSSWFCE